MHRKDRASIHSYLTYEPPLPLPPLLPLLLLSAARPAWLLLS
jgi:hypothetical protein